MNRQMVRFYAKLSTGLLQVRHRALEAEAAYWENSQRNDPTGWRAQLATVRQKLQALDYVLGRREGGRT